MKRGNIKKQFSKLEKLSENERQKGFTLVEVVVVMVVVGILTGIAIPTYLSWIPGIRLKSAARDLYSNMQLARIQALKDNVTVPVRFETGGDLDPSNDIYYYDTDGDGSYTAGEFRIRLNSYKNAVGFRVNNVPDIDDWNGNDAVTVNPTQISYTNKGTANSNSVFIENEDKTIIYSITVLTTGAIRLRKYYGGTWS